MMPHTNFRDMSDEDSASVIVYLRSLKPLETSHPKPQLPFPLNRSINNVPEPVAGPVPQSDLSTPAKRGAYMSKMAGCADCHTPMNDRGDVDIVLHRRVRAVRAE